MSNSDQKRASAFWLSTVVAKFRKAGDSQTVITAAGERMSKAFDEALTRRVLEKSISAQHKEMSQAA